MNNFIHTEKEFILDEKTSKIEEKRLKINKDSTDFEVRLAITNNILELLNDKDVINLNVFVSDYTFNLGEVVYKINFI